MAAAGSGATLTSYQDVANEVYLPRIPSAVNAGRVLLDAMMKPMRGRDFQMVQLAKNQGFGRGLQWRIHTGRNWAVGPRAPESSATNGYLPLGGSQDYQKGELASKLYVGVGQIESATMDMTKGPTAAGLAALDAEMTRLPDDVKRVLNYDLFTDGKGQITTVTSNTGTGTTVIPVASVRGFEEGQPITVALAADGTSAVDRVIQTIDADALTITVDTATTFSALYAIYWHGTYGTGKTNAFGRGIDGLGLIVSATADYATFDRSETEYAATRAIVFDPIAQASFKPSDIENMLRMMRRRNANCNLIICDWNIKVMLGDLFWSKLSWKPEATAYLGYPSLRMPEGANLVQDDDCPEWTMFFLDTSQIGLAWEVEMGADKGPGGQMFYRTYGPNGELGTAYQFAIRGKCNLIARNPGGTGKITITPTT